MIEKYIILEEISKGLFGKIYKGKNRYTNELIAIKKGAVGDQTIINESKIYNYLNNTKFIPIFKSFFNDEKNTYIIMELMENNIKILRNKLSYIERKAVIIQLIDSINFLHTKGIVHRDIKPDNFLISNNKIKISDFGFSKQIIINKKHISYKNIDKIIGTPNFISVNVHNLIEPTRRDDLESIAYLIIYLSEDLPWLDKNIEDTLLLKRNKYISLYRQVWFWFLPLYLP